MLDDILAILLIVGGIHLLLPRSWNFLGKSYPETRQTRIAEYCTAAGAFGAAAHLLGAVDHTNPLSWGLAITSTVLVLGGLRHLGGASASE